MDFFPGLPGVYCLEPEDVSGFDAFPFLPLVEIERRQVLAEAAPVVGLVLLVGEPGEAVQGAGFAVLAVEPEPGPHGVELARTVAVEGFRFGVSQVYGFLLGDAGAAFEDGFPGFWLPGGYEPAIGPPGRRSGSIRWFPGGRPWLRNWPCSRLGPGPA